MDRKLYAGARLREIRLGLGLTQTAFAARLGVSLSYLNQMENNNRPLSRGAIQGLASGFGIDVATFSLGEAERLIADLREALADPMFGDRPGQAEIEIAATNAPRLARAFLQMHQALRRNAERLASLDEALDSPRGDLMVLPWEEVRDFFHYCDNYIDAVDRAAELFARTTKFTGRGRLDRAAAWLAARHGIRVEHGGEALRRYDPARRVLQLGDAAGSATQAFQMAHQIALVEHGRLIEATLDLARFRTGEAREIARVGLANYFAGAACLPYGDFHAAAREERHDIDRLARRFDASAEQVAHRLSTLQRPDMKGIPFFFARVDQAGTITKRHSATRLQFARFGAACPLWNVHRAFETPGHMLRQLAETPDGARYLCLARDVFKSGGSFHAPTRRYAIALGCEVRYARELVYADGLDLDNAAAYEPIGVSCRICERADCHQRSVPPLERRLEVDPNRRGVLPYRIA